MKKFALALTVLITAASLALPTGATGQQQEAQKLYEKAMTAIDQVDSVRVKTTSKMIEPGMGNTTYESGHTEQIKQMGRGSTLQIECISTDEFGTGVEYYKDGYRYTPGGSEPTKFAQEPDTLPFSVKRATQVVSFPDPSYFANAKVTKVAKGTQIKVDMPASYVEVQAPILTTRRTDGKVRNGAITYTYVIDDQGRFVSAQFVCTALYDQSNGTTDTLFHSQKVTYSKYNELTSVPFPSNAHTYREIG